MKRHKPALAKPHQGGAGALVAALGRLGGGHGRRLGLLRLSYGGPSLLDTRARQDAVQGVIALVAGIFVDRSAEGVELIFPAPSGGPQGGIVNRETVLEPVIGGASKFLGDLQVFPRAHELLVLRDVGGFNHQRVAFKPTDRIAKIGADVVGAVLGV